jgi:porphobilinogen synthase
MPLLVRQGPTASPLPTFTLNEIGTAAAELAKLGVGAVKLFAGGADRAPAGGDAASPLAPMIHAIEAVKAAAPQMAVITENCLCSYTEGLCVLSKGGHYDHTGTLDTLAAQAVQQARAGADIIGPASMVDGHTGRVRAALDAEGHRDVALMPHLIYTSTMYGGYREAMRAAPRGNRAAFQVHISRPEQGLQTARQMVAEGADMLLLEPAVHTVDLLAALGRLLPEVPLIPFAVSGEWAEITYSGQRPVNEYYPALIERLRMYKRTGASAVVTYSALVAARHMHAARLEDDIPH